MGNFIKVSVWLIVLMFVVDWAFELITLNSTIANIVGYAIGIAMICVSVKTKCFTLITFNKNNHEKNN